MNGRSRSDQCQRVATGPRDAVSWLSSAAAQLPRGSGRRSYLLRSAINYREPQLLRGALL